jgi:adenylate kinase
MPGRRLLVIMLGAPGSGKGTQATRLAEKFGMAHESSGDVLRQAAEERTEAGDLAKKYFERGELAPDKSVCQIMIDHIEAIIGRGEGVLLDGFPRTLPQAARLEETLPALNLEISAVIHIRVDKEEIFRRLASRGRADDAEDLVGHRIDVYNDLTRPLVDFYSERDLLIEIDGGQSIEAVHDEIVVKIEGMVH